MKRHVYAWLYLIFAMAIAFLAEAIIKRGDVVQSMIWPIRAFAVITVALCFARFYTVLSDDK